MILSVSGYTSLDKNQLGYVQGVCARRWLLISLLIVTEESKVYLHKKMQISLKLASNL
jgi:hypothetical protein